MKKSFYASLRPFLRFCGSLKLAMLLLAVVIVASVAGTLIESRLDTEVALAYVYDAPWFIAWLILLCVNLVAAVAVRYPWKPHQIGFVITHGGIVVILIGGMIGRIWGVEGNMTLVAGGPPQDFLVVNETILQVQSGKSQETRSYPVNLTLRPPTRQQPVVIDKGDVRISALGFAEELGSRTVVEPGGTRGLPAVRLTLSGDMAPHPIEQWLLLDDPRRGVLSVGRNVVRFTGEENAQDATLASDRSLSREVHFVFSKMPEINLARRLAGGPSGATVQYRFAPNARGGGEGLGVVEIAVGDSAFEFPVRETLARTVPLEGTGWSLRAMQYFADFRMDGRLPVSASEEPNNPAVVFELVGPPAGDACCDHEKPVVEKNQELCPHSGQEVVATGGEAECSHGAEGGTGTGEDACCSGGAAGAMAQAGRQPHGHGHGGGRGQAHHKSHELTVIYREGELRFVSSSGTSEEPGEIRVGEEFSTGWGWDFRVEEFLEKAVLREVIGPLEPGNRSIGASGLLVKIEQGGDAVERWLQMGTTAVVNAGGEHLHLGFGYRLLPLSFSVALERFEVEFNEGTTTPASFKSHVRFIDANSGESLTRQIWMNNPANFPYFRGVGFLGTSYKFSQSSWNPGNLNQSTLQVIRDPGWLFKWVGSLVFCLGLVTIFYIKPYPRWARQRAETTAAAAKEPAQRDTAGLPAPSAGVQAEC